MNIIQKIKILLLFNRHYQKIKNLVKKEVDMNGNVKPGYRSTEFWLVVISSGVSIYTAVQGLIPADLSAKIIGGVIMVYTISRAIVKFTPSKKDDELLDKIEQIVKSKQ